MSNERGGLPTDIRLSFISSLYRNRGILVIGMLLHVAAFLLVFLKTSDAFYLGCTLAILLLWVLRNLDMLRFERSDISGADYAAVKKWENRYVAGGIAVTLTCGIACAYAIAVSREPFAQLACISVTLASLSPLAGRNFGSERAVLLLSAAACLPMMIAAFSLGDPFMAALAFLILPFILSTRMMANNVRAFLSEKVLSARNENLRATREISKIASQFETALNSMARGLFMFDRQNRVVVVNERAAELLRLGDKAEVKGMLLEDVLERSARAMALDTSKSAYIARELQLLTQGKRARTLISVAEDLFFEFLAVRRENGEFVVTLEDMTTRVQAERKVLQMARFDTLTGLSRRDYSAALSEAKNRNEGSCAAFEEEMEVRYLDRQKLKDDLHEAVALGAFELAYQPMFTPDGSSVESCEALARWIHPERGPVPPEVFIQLAEELGLVTEITRLVVGQACRDCLSWPPNVAVSVNLSVLDLYGDEIVAILTGALEETGLTPDRLHLEVTESCLMSEPARVQAVLHALRAIGMTIAIDDFGTGYSSLSYLDALPVSVIKIDRAFIQDIDEDSRRFKLLLGIVHLARALELKIVVEGVETTRQLQLLRQHSCADLIQGFVFASPMPASEVAARCMPPAWKGALPSAPHS